MQTGEGIARDVFRLIIWFPFRWLISLLPVNYGLVAFKLLGDLHFYTGRGKKKKITQNIMAVLNKDEAAALSITKKYYENHYVDRLHIFLYPKLTTKEKIKRYISFENLDTLERELKAGRGVLIVQPHFGPVQITLLALSLSGFNPVQIGYPKDIGLSRIGRAVAFRYRLKYEAMLPPILPANKYLGKAYKHLANGGVVFTTGDGAGGGIRLGEHREFTFFNAKTMFPLGPAAWAVKTGSAFIPTFIITEGYNKFRIVFEKPIEGMHKNLERDMVYITGKFISVFENYVRRYPHCWHFWDEI
ncbi:MAG: lysophospholipid acyltransferase family protein [Nitrospirae bacterium]|nr:lysophospholipid acyltransferase family protein [Nitrospirota bacterium]